MLLYVCSWHLADIDAGGDIPGPISNVS